MTTLEHANITVPSIDAAIRFLNIVAPDFRVRADEYRDDHYRWAHIGNDYNYLALQEPNEKVDAEDRRNPYYDIGINHLALTVSGVEDIKAKLELAGYRVNGDMQSEPFRKRVYFWDEAGFEWELVEYFTDDAAKRYIYE